MSCQGNRDKTWYLIYTKPRAESVAQENLERQGYTTYLPLIRTTRRRNARFVTSIEAMFSRYLFIQLNQVTDNWSPIRSTIGVSSMVSLNGMPTSIPNSLIEYFKSGQDEHGVFLIEEKRLNPGDPVRVIDGVFNGLKGIFEARTSRERVSILLNIAGQFTRVNLSRHELRYA